LQTVVLFLLSDTSVKIWPAEYGLEGLCHPLAFQQGIKRVCISFHPLVVFWPGRLWQEFKIALDSPGAMKQEGKYILRNTVVLSGVHLDCLPACFWSPCWWP